MLDLDEVLADAVGPIEPSFTLDEVVSEGRGLRRRRRVRTIAYRGALAIVFVALVGITGNRLRPTESSSVAIQPGTGEPPRFVVAGPESDAILHLPSVFDSEPVPRGNWPERVSGSVGPDAQVWDLGILEDDARYHLSLDLAVSEACLFRASPVSNRVQDHCLSLFDLAMSAIGTPRSQRGFALAAREYEGATLVSEASKLGAVVEGGVVIPGSTDLPSLDLSPLVRAVLRSKPAERERDEHRFRTTMAVDGARRSLTGVPGMACIRGDRGLAVRLGLPEGTLRLTASEGQEGFVNFDAGQTMEVWGNFAPKREGLGTIIFMDPMASAEEIASVSAVLDVSRHANKFEYFDKQKALDEFRQMYVDNDQILGAVTPADMPTSFRLAGHLGSDLTEFEAMPGIYEIVNAFDVFKLGSPVPRGTSVVAGMGRHGPVLHATYERLGQLIDITVVCGRDHLDARTVTETPPTQKRNSAIEVLDIGGPVGQLRIPSIGVDLPVVRGVEREILEQGVGSYPSTSLPGLTGNAAMAAHRTTYGAPFLRLDGLSQGDAIITESIDGPSLYIVQDVKVVDQTDVSVLQEFGDNRLTLTTEHPAYGSSDRLVVHALLVGEPTIASAAVSASTELAPDPAALE